MQLANVLRRPVISEKSLKDTASGVYTFVVAKKATKPEIAKAIAEQFKVKVLSVKTLNLPAKPKRAGRRRQLITYQPGFKKAYVRIPADQKIELFEQGKK